MNKNKEKKIDINDEIAFFILTDAIIEFKNAAGSLPNQYKVGWEGVLGFALEAMKQSEHTNIHVCER